MRLVDALKEQRRIILSKENFETKIVIDPHKKWVRITHKIIPDRLYDKKSLKEYIDKLNTIYQELEDY